MRVVKIGGRAQNDPRIHRMICSAWEQARNSLCVVHGGGDEVSALQKIMGSDTVFVGGRRVTSKGDLEILRMVMSGMVNKRLVSDLVAAGLPAVGLSGEDAALIEAEIIDAATLGYAGTPKKVNADLLRSLMKAGYLPVVSPVSLDVASSEADARTLNVNGDDAAAAIAGALGADELLFIADVEGVRAANGQTLQCLSIDQAQELVAKGVAGGGMAAKLEAAATALAAGVELVRICDLIGITDPERGTFITQSEGVVT